MSKAIKVEDLWDVMLESEARRVAPLMAETISWRWRTDSEMATRLDTNFAVVRAARAMLLAGR